jgi:LacI family transcriptional regulator
LFSEIARAVEEEAFNLGYQIILCSSWRQIGRGCKYMETLADDDSVLAVIYVSSGEDDGFLPGLERVSAKKALVVIDAAVKGLVADHVTTDDAVGAFEAVDSLIKSGRRKIAFLTAQRDVSTLNSRFDGYRRALKENGLAFDEGLVITDPNCDPKGGFEAMARALGSGFDADALFCSADSMTEGALKALHEAGVSIPSQLRVIGFGDLKFDNPYKLSLSSVGQPFSEMGVRAMRLADERVRGAGPRGVCRELALPVKLHIRET